MEKRPDLHRRLPELWPDEYRDYTAVRIRLVQRLGYTSLSQTMGYTAYERDADTEAVMAEPAADTRNQTKDVILLARGRPKNEPAHDPLPDSYSCRFS